MKKWLFLALVLIFFCMGVEVYRNVTLMDRGYLLQKLRTRRDSLIEENGYLREKVSRILSLEKIEEYAREKLDMVNPERVRFLSEIEQFSPPAESPSPPLLEKKMVRVRDFFIRLNEKIKNCFKKL